MNPTVDGSAPRYDPGADAIAAVTLLGPGAGAPDGRDLPADAIMGARRAAEVGVHRVLILGGGFGGIAAAVALRERLDPGDEIVLVERQPTFVMGLRKNWALLRAGALAEGERTLAGLESRGIRVVQGTIEAIEPADRAAIVDGERLRGDALVVALGAERDPDRIPGFREHAINIYDRDASDRGREALEHFGGGRLAIGIFGAPYPCPPAPFELAMLLRERFSDLGTAAEIVVFSPLPMSLPILGRAGCGTFELQLEFSGIEFLRERQAASVAPRSVVFVDGSSVEFDLLLGVPPHRVPAVVTASGLTQGAPWVKVDPRTLETAFPGVHAIGDVTAIPLANGQMLPKAGAFAHAEGDVVAARIADSLAGRESTAVFEAQGTCFLETGGGTAAMVTGRFFEEPPAVVLTDPAPEHLAAKHAFESDRLAAWFGG